MFRSRLRTRLGTSLKAPTFASPRRTLHRVPTLPEQDHFSQNGVPEFMSPAGFKLAWSDYMGLVTEKLNEMTAGEAIRYRRAQSKGSTDDNTRNRPREQDSENDFLCDCSRTKPGRHLQLGLNGTQPPLLLQRYCFRAGSNVPRTPRSPRDLLLFHRKPQRRIHPHRGRHVWPRLRLARDDPD